jgi:dTDP-4-amino-4,6-dideoxygalactose transaminase
MTERRYHIPFFQPLPPRDLLAGRTDLSRTFPFSEQRITHYYLARNAIWHGVDSLGLKPGDEVLMPSYHHGVDLEVLLARGLKPRFYRVGESTWIDPEDVERAYVPSVKALYVIHYFGFAQPIAALQSFAKKRGIPLIEDCALSLFSRTDGRPLGSFGDIGIFCLYKTLALPHGGTLVRNRAGLPAPPKPIRPHRMSSVAYVSNLMIDHVAMRFDGAGPRLATLGRTFGRATKHAIGAATVPIDTSDLDAGVIPFGMGRIARHLLARIRPAEVIATRRRNFEHLASLLGGSVRPLFRELPEGVCPLSFPLLVRDKPRVHEELLADGVGNVNFWSRTRPEVPREQFPEAQFLRGAVLEVPIHQGFEPKHIEFIAERVLKRAAG